MDRQSLLSLLVRCFYYFITIIKKFLWEILAFKETLNNSGICFCFPIDSVHKAGLMEEGWLICFLSLIPSSKYLPTEETLHPLLVAAKIYVPDFWIALFQSIYLSPSQLPLAMIKSLGISLLTGGISLKEGSSRPRSIW